MGGKAAGIEIYAQLRYFAVTGQRLDGTSPNIQFRKLGWLRERFWPKPAPSSPPDYGQPQSKIIERARAYVAKMDAAISGQGGHDQTYTVACRLVLGFALSEESAWPVLLEYNQRCEPPWSEGELRHKLRDALKHEGPRGDLLEKDRSSRNGRQGKNNGAGNASEPAIPAGA